MYNDWQSVYKLVEEINNLSLNKEFEISVYIFNDYSNHDRPDFEKNLENINSIKIFNMKKNQGHARCIATGLKYIFEKDNFDYVIPMDGDGEDRPEEIEFFLDQIKKSQDKPIVGERIKRSEKMIFKICYQLHKFLTLVFTSKSIKFGNYTCLPRSIVEKMIGGRMTKFVRENSLVGQAFVKNVETTVEELLTSEGAEVSAMIRYEVGEGLEKRSDDFVAEVMAQVG